MALPPFSLDMLKGLLFPPKSRAKSTIQIGEIRYYDGTELTRDQDTPHNARVVTLVAMLLAAIIGIVFLFNYFDGIMNEPIRQQEKLQANLDKEITLDLPVLSTLMPLSDEDIMAKLQETGDTLYERTPIGTDPNGGFEVIKLPSDVSLQEAGVMYLTGVDNLSAADAAKLLNGAWTLSVSRKSGTEIKVRYADFTSGSIEKAMHAAMQAEGLDNAEISDNGVDDAGNTYQAGTIKTDDGTYTWRVSVIALSEVYDISGLPNTAYFVGIRFNS